MFLRKIPLEIWFMILFATSCGPKLTVNLAESALTWRVDDFFDIDQNQRQKIKSDFRLFLQDVHQNELKSARALVLDSDWPANSCREVETKYVVISDLFDQVQKKFLSRAENLVDSIHDKQLKYFVEALEDEISDDEKKLKDKATRTERRVSQTLRTWNELFDDSLTPKQTLEIKAHIEGSEDLSALFLENRKRMLSDVKEVQKKGSSQVSDYFKRYLRDRSSLQVKDFQEASLKRRKSSEAFFIQLICNASLDQKKSFQSTIRAYLDAIEEVYIKPKS